MTNKITEFNQKAQADFQCIQTLDIEFYHNKPLLKS